jgi:hypothetical protein
MNSESILSSRFSANTKKDGIRPKLVLQSWEGSGRKPRPKRQDRFADRWNQMEKWLLNRPEFRLSESSVCSVSLW